jgi:hypothetical protein
MFESGVSTDADGYLVKKKKKGKAIPLIGRGGL